MNFRKSSKTGQIGLIILELFALVCSKTLFLCDNFFSFDRFFLLLADKVDIDEISDDFENWPDRIINLNLSLSAQKVLVRTLLVQFRSIFV